MTMGTKHFTQRMELDRFGKNVTARVDLEVDLDALFFDLGNKAIRNKSKRSRLQVGVTAEVRDIQEVQK